MTACSRMLVAALLLWCAGSSVNAAVVELRYSGSLIPDGKDSDGNAVKKFNLYCLVQTADDGASQIAYVLDERGGGGWSWPERFGQLDLDQNQHPLGKSRLMLLHNHDGTDYPLALPVPVFEYGEKLQEGASWTVEKLAYEVGGQRKVGRHQCWRVEVSTNFGPRQVLDVEVGTNIVIRSEQRVFVGRGDRFELEMRLDSITPADDSRTAALQPALASLLKLQGALQRKDGETRPELTPDQLAVASESIETLVKQAEDTPFARLTSDIKRDLQGQMQRDSDVGKLAEKLIDQPAPDFTLKTLKGETIESDSLRGKIVLLHFWKYDGDKLEEPYGQVGYLDFLNSRRRKLGVQIIGVATNPRLGDDETSAIALRSVKKLRDFMNLSYPIALDDGALLRKFGDPTRAGAKLPLWVVIDPDGKIVAYDVGFYAIKPDEGLRQLDEKLVELIRAQRDKKE